MVRLLCVLLSLIASGCGGEAQQWIDAFGYDEAEVHAVEIGRFGYPYVPVQVAGSRINLPFDTGNMAGLAVSTEWFNRLDLSADAQHQRLDSAGRSIGTARVASDVRVSLWGQHTVVRQVVEFDHPTLAGLLGPDLLPGTHFTLDYQSGRLAVGEGGLPDSIPGFEAVPLIRSRQHPRLILVRGTIGHTPVVIELDTGKSRSVINPRLAERLQLEAGPQGVRIPELQIGSIAVEIPRAKRVDQTGIDPDLPEPIMAGIGSDVLSRFVWTVDYETGLLWIPADT